MDINDGKTCKTCLETRRLHGVCCRVKADRLLIAAYEQIGTARDLIGDLGIEARGFTAGKLDAARIGCNAGRGAVLDARGALEGVSLRLVGGVR